MWLLLLALSSSLLSWLPTGVTVQSNGNNQNWFGRGCPPHATGQFPYEGDCKRFYNCYKGRGQLSVCAPGTLFNPEILECDFPSKVQCLKGAGRGPENSKNSRVVDDPYYHGHHRHHHHSPHFQHSPEYHSQGYQSERSGWSPQMQHSHHYHNWEQTHSHHSPQPLQPGHYIYDIKSTKSGGGSSPRSHHSGVQPPRSYHSGVQPPGILPAMPSQELLPPKVGSYEPPLPQEYPQPPSDQSLYASHYGRTPPSPQQSFYTDSQPSYQAKDFDQKFDTVLPRPAITYNSYGSAPGQRNGGTIVFPEGHSEQPPQQAPYYPQVPVEESYNPYKGSGHEPSVVPAGTPQGVYVIPNEGQGRIPPNFNYPAGNSNGEEIPSISTEPPKTSNEENFCPKEFSGLLPHTDCTKFLSCSFGRTFIMDCGPGTRFNPHHMVCDHPHNVKCYSGQANNDDIDVLSPEESQNPPDTFQIPNRDRVGDEDYEIQTEQESTTTIISTTDIPQQTEIPESLEQYEFLNKKPEISIKVSQSGEPQQGSSSVFRPANITLPKGKFISKRNSTLDKQLLRLRGSPSQFEGFVEMQLAPGSWGIVCDKHNNWKSEEAHVVCKTLGFPRGAELTWQGLPADVSNVTSELLAADEVICTGAEESILECTFNIGSGCDPGKDGIWVRCYGHGQSRCEPGELSLEGNCYSLVVPDEDVPNEELVGFTQGEALKYCQTKGGRLLDVTSQLENDFVSEWLIRQNVDGNIMTSGVGTLLMGVPVWIWEGGESAFFYHNWWPGWKGVTSMAPKLSSGNAHCIVLRRHFPCVENIDGEEKLCDAQYYYWDVEDCKTMSTSQPYVCERPANNIGCVMGSGASYKGAGNVTKTGKHCLNWESKEVLAELKYKIAESDRKMSLSGHNYCRNVAGKESHPWCFIRDGYSVKKELCDIPLCSKAIEKSARYYQCPPNHYSCGVNGECIPSNKVCDGHYDCSNANDESGCGRPQNLEVPTENTLLSQFTLHVNMQLTIMEIEIIIETPLSKCAQLCLAKDNCRSFSYLVPEEQCLLSESNIGLSGGLINAPNWNYYEVRSKSINCQAFTCKNGKCIANETVCNSKNDCGDNSDESDCSWLKQKIEIRLTGGGKPNEGAIEVKALDKWGLVCDDEFDMKDGDVICKHLGYPLGALEIKKHGYFKPNHTSSFIIDNLNCTGNETSIADCHHNGWGIHDCGNEESAGIICKETKSDCSFNYWQCEKSTECIPLVFLCDNVKDCADSSDEDPAKCEADIAVRLVGVGGVSRSNKVTEGRVEVRRFGVWGTVCDDDFGEKEASVVCNSLGFKGSAQAYKEAAYGAGEGIIWLDQVHCLGNETNIADCMSDPWGQTNCRHNEDVAVACSSQSFNIPPKEITKDGQDSPDQNIEDDDDLQDYLFIPDCGTVMDDLDVMTSDFTPRVVSGFETIKGTYPWQASIRVKSASGKSYHWCGAVVVSRFHVITAGHCLRDYIKAAYFVRTGDYDNEVDEGTEKDYEIDGIWIHPNLDKGVRLNNDIAVVKVKGPGIVFDTWVLPACLPSKRQLQLPENCTISGWGSNSSPGTGFARTLHATWLSPLPPSKCRSPLIYGDSMSEGMFCAGSLDGGPDSCQGDSGGPLLCPQRGQLTLFGITSWGHGCGRSNSPGVYTNVPYYLDWINEKIKMSMKNYQRVNTRRTLYD